MYSRKIRESNEQLSSIEATLPHANIYNNDDDKRSKLSLNNTKYFIFALLTIIFTFVSLTFLLGIDYNKILDKIIGVPSDKYEQTYVLNEIVTPRKQTDVEISWPGCLASLPYPDNRKHIVAPPPGPATLVCCNTTKGTLNIEVHPSWAPKGAERFMFMVRDGFFKTRIGLFRALKGFLIQFGLAGDPKVHQRYHSYGNLKDDRAWLPQGPPGREINGVKRYQKGYLGYAGAGNNSRGTQLIMAFEDNLYLGYGEKVSQGKIMNRGNSYLEKEFPLLDYITDCVVVRENVPWIYIHQQN